MLTSIRIQNFRSIRDAQVKLGQVNLFIGPNNSGKSNFLKGIEFAANRLELSNNYTATIFDQVVNKEYFHSAPDEINPFSGESKKSIKIDTKFSFKYPGITPSNSLIFSRNGDFDTSHTHIVNEGEGEASWNSLTEQEKAKLTSNTPRLTRNLLNGTVVYRPDPTKFLEGKNLSFVEKLDFDAQNIILFLFNLSQNHESLFNKLKKDFENCVGTLTRVATPADPNNSGLLKLKFFDAQENSYWAEEVSDGVLYFLALLCIVHQPNPPKLLLLEEPEKGIHPRRIREVMDFIFELARLRNIQIILTSHSPYVVDSFSDSPECISIFDRDPATGNTIINNAAEYIEQTNTELASQDLPPVSYTDSLGEYWVSGFLGGVPLSL
jgi:predicted ATPase